MQPEAWRQMRQPWMRWPRRCCMFPKTRDCSQPRDVSPYPRGSTSFFPRRKHRQRGRPGGGVIFLNQPIRILSHRGDACSLLCPSYSPPPTDMTRVCLGPSEKARHWGISSIRVESSVAHPADISSDAGSVFTADGHVQLPGLNPHRVKMKN